MALNENDRLEFQAWLIRNDLDERIAHAILDTMAPYDWHEQATKAHVAEVKADVAEVKADVAEVKADLASFKTEAGHRFDLVDQRFGLMDQRFESLEQFMRSMQASFDKRMADSANRMDKRFDELGREMRVVTWAIIGFIVAMVITMIGGVVALA